MIRDHTLVRRVYIELPGAYSIMQKICRYSVDTFSVELVQRCAKSVVIALPVTYIDNFFRYAAPSFAHCIDVVLSYRSCSTI